MPCSCTALARDKCVQELNLVQNVEPDPRKIGQKGAFCKGLVEKLREMCSLMRVNLLNLLMADGEGIFI
jgi:hypothetical protein